MYKQIYKKACEEIKGDKDAILNKAFERAAQPEKKKSPILKYSVIGTAAAAVIVAGAVILNWDVLKMPLDDIVSEDSADAVIEESSELGEEIVIEDDAAVPETETEAEAQRSVAAEETVSEKESAAETPAVTESTTESAAQSRAVQTEAEAEKAETAEVIISEERTEEAGEEEIATEFVLSRGRSMATENSDEDADEAADNALTSSSSTAGRSGGAGRKTEVVAVSEEDDCDYDEEYDDFDGGTMMLTAGWSDINYNVEALTYDEYINYLGFDVSGIKLPEGMSFDWIEESVYEIYTDDAGEIADDMAMFTASGEEKCITIMTTRMTALDEEFASYENVAANVARNGDYAVYAVKNGAYVTIEFDNVESEEIDAIVRQLAE